MEKIKLIQPLWNAKPGTVLEVSKIRAEFAIRKNKAVLVAETKPQFAPENKAEKRPKKNK